jgi:hypothetical protein
MKNFSSYIDADLISKIIKSHEIGVMGNAIDKSILLELKSIKPEYLSNLECSEECVNFLDSFLSDVKEFNRTGEGSNYAEEFCNQ